MNTVNRYTTILLSIGLVMWLQAFVTIEWSYPYCLSQSDGPAYAAQGMPLPYWMWNGVVSLEHDFLPHIYILNIILLSLLLFPFIQWVLNRAISPRLKWLQCLIGAVGGLLVISQIALIILGVSIGYYRPEKTLGLESYNRYSDFRPVRIGFHRSNAPDCKPSRFWFPDGWRPE